MEKVLSGYRAGESGLGKTVAGDGILTFRGTVDVRVKCYVGKACSGAGRPAWGRWAFLYRASMAEMGEGDVSKVISFL